MRRALILSRGDWGIFVERPVAATMLAVVLVYLALPAVMWAWRRRARA